LTTKSYATANCKAPCANAGASLLISEASHNQALSLFLCAPASGDSRYCQQLLARVLIAELEVKELLWIGPTLKKLEGPLFFLSCITLAL
jgi:hypothetical protein